MQDGQNYYNIQYNLKYLLKFQSVSQHVAFVPPPIQKRKENTDQNQFAYKCITIKPMFFSATSVFCVSKCKTLVFSTSSFQIGVRGPAGVLEGNPGGSQLNYRWEPDGPLTQSVQMEPNGHPRNGPFGSELN